jgi:hypothetical protein
MEKGYRFDTDDPEVGKEHYAFRTLADCMDFANSQGKRGEMKIYEIEGYLVRDEGGPDGLVIRVRFFRRLE